MRRLQQNLEAFCLRNCSIAFFLDFIDHVFRLFCEKKPKKPKKSVRKFRKKGTTRRSGARRLHSNAPSACRMLLSLVSTYVCPNNVRNIKHWTCPRTQQVPHSVCTHPLIALFACSFRLYSLQKGDSMPLLGLDRSCTQDERESS